MCQGSNESEPGRGQLMRHQLASGALSFDPQKIFELNPEALFSKMIFLFVFKEKNLSALSPNPISLLVDFGSLCVYVYHASDTMLTNGVETSNQRAYC